MPILTIDSPCDGTCKIDVVTGWCEGCHRTIDEIIDWPNADAEAKAKILAALPPRKTRELNAKL
jgi:uncharacterized protein